MKKICNKKNLRCEARYQPRCEMPLCVMPLSLFTFAGGVVFIGISALFWASGDINDAWHTALMIGAGITLGAGAVCMAALIKDF